MERAPRRPCTRTRAGSGRARARASSPRTAPPRSCARSPRGPPTRRRGASVTPRRALVGALVAARRGGRVAATGSSKYAEGPPRTHALVVLAQQHHPRRDGVHAPAPWSTDDDREKGRGGDEARATTDERGGRGLRTTRRVGWRWGVLRRGRANAPRASRPTFRAQPQQVPPRRRPRVLTLVRLGRFGETLPTNRAGSPAAPSPRRRSRTSSTRQATPRTETRASGRRDARRDARGYCGRQRGDERLDSVVVVNPRRSGRSSSPSARFIRPSLANVTCKNVGRLGTL